jgi:hypothetical protein
MEITGKSWANAGLLIMVSMMAPKVFLMGFSGSVNHDGLNFG